MSRIGKQLIHIPEKTDVVVSDDTVTVKGPLGELSRSYTGVQVDVKDNMVHVTPANNSKLSRALWGTFASHIKNMVGGVNSLYEKKLVVEGVGYKVEMSGKDLLLNVGFSHQVKMTVPDGLHITVEKNVITISGSDKEKVGQLASEIRAVKKPEPYKGKGIRYENEVVKRKQGKKAVT